MVRLMISDYVHNKRAQAIEVAFMEVKEHDFHLTLERSGEPVINRALVLDIFYTTLYTSCT
jgi:hypothetical protein